ncbi:MAG: 4-hydroxy-tetrahydrodipicolinate reductase [Bacteroidetes bacterium]|nr:4-hydroxy-tetrahydrodipicolinate reductase [Bacteroidota bacterium]
MPLKIALIGYGKMGKAVEKIAISRGHRIALKIDLDNMKSLSQKALRGSDAVIEFTGNNSAYKNVIFCLNAGLPVICGSTGWNDRHEDAANYCRKKNGAFLYSPNFSIGANLFFALNKNLAALMKNKTEYSVKVKETHHLHKKDAPSGTAVKLAEQILQVYDGAKKKWTLGDSYDPAVLPVISERKGEVTGIHSVLYESDNDTIEIIHNAKSRYAFALGAVVGAEWLVRTGKKGVFTLSDILTFA